MKHRLSSVVAFLFAFVFMTVKVYALTGSLVSQTNVTCAAGNNGSVTVTQSGGTGPYTYSWAPAGGTSATATGLTGGGYTCTITDQFDMQTAIVTVSITQPTPININLSWQDIFCYGNCTGAITAIVSGGTPGYTYSWLPGGQTTANVNNRCPGNYNVTITDAAGCSSQSSVTITQPAAPLSFSINVTATTCGQNNGTASVYNLAGGTPPYQFYWSNTAQTTMSVTALPSGNFSCMVTDANGCQLTLSSWIGNSSGPVANAGTDTTICYGDSVQLSASGSGGLTPYSYLWVGPSGFYSSLNNPVVSPPVTSTYTVQLTDASGCTTIDFVTVTVHPPITLTFNSISANCNQSDGQANVIASGGVAPFSFLWSNSSINDSIFNINAGLYSVDVTDANGCIASGQVAVNNIGGPSISFTGVSNPTCYNAANGSVTANVSGSAPPYTYSWNTTPIQIATTANSLSAGNYFCTVTDNNNCQSSSLISLTQPPQLFVGAQILSPSNCTGGGTARAWAGGGIPPYSYLWSNSITDDTSSNIPVGSATVIITDNIGCTVPAQLNMPGITATLITGKIYLDLNANCAYDSTDIPVAGQIVELQPANYYTTSDANGNYRAWIFATGNQTVSAQVNWMSNYITGFCPANATTTINVNNLCDTINNVDFSYTLVPGIQDLRVSMAMQIPRSGMPQWVTIQYDNVGTVPVFNTSVQLVFDSLLTYVSSTQSPSINQSGFLEWNTGTLQPGQGGTITTTLYVPNTQNGGYIGRNLFYSASVWPVAGDNYSTDNGEDENHAIVASYDPNAKTVDAEGLDSLGNITPQDSILYYTIYFQNTGTDTAFTVEIQDTLSPYLDPLTIIPGASSHPYSFQMSGSGALRFTFYNILLPDSNHNEPASHGYVTYSIKVRDNLPPGTTIENTAHIYFDFNPAVVTNTTSNTISIITVSGNVADSKIGVDLYPNPASEVIWFQFSGSPLSRTIVVSDQLGQEIWSKQTSESVIEFPASQFAAGMYFYTISEAEGLTLNGKFLIEH